MFVFTQTRSFIYHHLSGYLIQGYTYVNLIMYKCMHVGLNILNYNVYNYWIIQYIKFKYKFKYEKLLNFIKIFNFFLKKKVYRLIYFIFKHNQVNWSEFCDWFLIIFNSSNFEIRNIHTYVYVCMILFETKYCIEACLIFAEYSLNFKMHDYFICDKLIILW